MLKLKNGLHIAFKEFGASNPKKLLALHGWLDNANSFNFLGPFLADRGYHVFAIDHMGHGHSSHLPQHAMYQIPRYVTTVKEVMSMLNWEKPGILGHSMGAAIGLLHAGAFPDDLSNLVMIDNFGPYTQRVDATAQLVRKAVEYEMEMHALTGKFSKRKGAQKVYDHIGLAIEARMRTATTFPGKQYISVESATALVERGVDVLPKANESDDNHPVRFRHDTRLLQPSYIYFSPEQVHSIASQVTCPVLYITGENGWPPSCKSEIAHRKEILENKGLLTSVTLPGSHHLHLDPETAPAVANTVYDFLLKSNY